MRHIQKDVELLTKLLDIPAEMIFEETGSLSQFCISELSQSVTLPSGYSFSREYRIPRPGDYFLDLNVLARDHRLIVYKSKSYGDAEKIIMACESGEGSSVSFCLDTCVNEDSHQAFMGSQKVRLLNAYVDSSSRVAVLDPSNNRILIVHISELRNVRHGLKHTNRLSRWFRISSQDKKNIADLENEIFGP